MYDHLDIDDLRAEISKTAKIIYAAIACSNRMKEVLTNRIKEREEDFYEGDKVCYSNRLSVQTSKGVVISHDQERSITKVRFIKEGVDELEVRSMFLTMRL
jgi:hypothetical protein